MYKQSDARQDELQEMRDKYWRATLAGGAGALGLGVLAGRGASRPLFKAYEAKKAAQRVAALRKQRGILANLAGKHPLMSLGGATLLGGLGGQVFNKLNDYYEF